MADWAKVLQILRQELLPRVNPAAVERWLTSLKHAPDGERLGVCLAIDFGHRSIDEPTLNLLAAVIDSFTNMSDARYEFATKLYDHPRREDFFCKSRFVGTKPTRPYATVLTIQKFIASAGSAFGFVDSPDDKNRIRTRYGASFTPMVLREFNIWWTGDVGIVWVGDSDQLLTILSSVGSDERGSKVKDALGLVRPPYLTPNRPLEFVAMQYPVGFDKTCYQPTTLDAWWLDSGHFYLSYGEDDAWGRTQSCSGNGPPFRERVHRVHELEVFSEEYQLMYIGIVNSSPEDRSRALKEAYERLDRVP